MLERILGQLRDNIRRKQYVITLHAEEEMVEDSLTIFDIESVVLTGEIVERQRDRVTAQRKYRIAGQTVDGEAAEILAKLSPTGKVVLIAVYAL